MRMWGPGLREMSEIAVLNANYLLARLRDAYDLPVDRHCMHEFVVSARSAQARARRHGPGRGQAADGLRLPPAHDLLPADRARGADDRADRDRDAWRRWTRSATRCSRSPREAADDPQMLKDAPHTRPVSRLDEAEAAKRLLVRYGFDEHPTRGRPRPVLRAVAVRLPATRWPSSAGTTPCWRRGVRALLARSPAPTAARRPRGPGSCCGAGSTGRDPVDLRRDRLRGGRRRRAGRARRRRRRPAWMRRCVGRVSGRGHPARRVHPRRARAARQRARARPSRRGTSPTRSTRPSYCRADLGAQGIAGRADAIVLSCELGVRKPHPAVYRGRRAGARGCDPAEMLFVGDRVLEDVVGPDAAGMTARAWPTWYRR